MTITKLSDEINQLADRIPAGDRFRTCDILPMLRRRHNGVRLTQIGGWLARRDDIRKVNNDGLWEKVRE